MGFINNSRIELKQHIINLGGKRQAHFNLIGTFLLTFISYRHVY